jgi:uncharacterized protein involved in exopolysaccharide biosynthesis
MEFQNDLQFYLRVFKRRKWQCIIPAVGAMVICAMLAFMLPSIYRSSGLILIETQDIPEDLVQSTVTGLIEERLQGLNRTMLSRSRLVEVIEQFDLYEAERAHQSMSEIIAKMRDDIQVEMVTTEVHDAERARSGTATYAFSLSYDGKDPEKVLQVANSLVSLYLEANIQSRERQTRSAYQYLEGRLEGLGSQIEEVKQRLSVFKKENKFFLPELVPLNTRLLDRMESRLRFKENDLEKARSRMEYWLRELAARPQYIQVRTTGGERLITPEEELDRMRRDLVALKATRSANHPDVISLQKEVDALEEQVKYRQDMEEYSEELERKENELAMLKEKYTEEHPDVRRLQSEVEQLQADMDSLSERFMIKPKHKEMELNPQWIQANNEVETSKINVDRLEKDVADILKQHAELQNRLDMAPQVEVDYNVMLSEMQTLEAERDDLLRRMLAAKESKGLEESGLGEKFTLVDPPVLADQPYSPNRPLLLALGLMLSVSLGAGVGLVGHLLDRTVHNAEELMALTGIPVLAVIPDFSESGRTSGALQFKRRLPALIAVSVGIALLAFHLLVEPLHVMVMRLIQGVF